MEQPTAKVLAMDRRRMSPRTLPAQGQAFLSIDMVEAPFAHVPDGSHQIGDCTNLVIGYRDESTVAVIVAHGTR
jgi:hypothetical protein